MHRRFHLRIFRSIWFLRGLILLMGLLVFSLNLAEGITSSRQDVTWFFQESIILLACYLFLILVWRQQKAESVRKKERTLLAPWLIGYLIVISFSLALVLLADPYSRFGVRPFSRLILPTSVKVDAYNDLAEPPQIVILGSSRALPISPSFLQERSGASTFNFAVQGTSTETLLILSRFMQEKHKFPELLLIEVSPPLERGVGAIAERTPPSLFPFTKSELIIQIIWQDFSSLFSIRSVSDAFYLILRYTWSGVPGYEAYFDRLGEYHDPNLNNGINQEEMTAAVQSTWIQDCQGTDPIGLQNIEEVIRIAAEEQSAVILLQTPRYTTLYQRMMVDPGYLSCQAEFEATMQELTLKNPNVRYIDYTQLDSVDQLDLAAFRDAQHLSYQGANALVDAVTPTIQRTLAQVLMDRSLP